jgi:hypothetical protein
MERILRDAPQPDPHIPSTTAVLGRASLRHTLLHYTDISRKTTGMSPALLDPLLLHSRFHRIHAYIFLLQSHY